MLPVVVQRRVVDPLSYATGCCRFPCPLSPALCLLSIIHFHCLPTLHAVLESVNRLPFWLVTLACWKWIYITLFHTLVKKDVSKFAHENSMKGVRNSSRNGNNNRQLTSRFLQWLFSVNIFIVLISSTPLLPSINVILFWLPLFVFWLRNVFLCIFVFA